MAKHYLAKIFSGRVIPSAIGCFLTGLMYSQFTFWGYLKHWWLIVKMVANVFFLVVGFLWLVPMLRNAARAIRDFPQIAAGYDVIMYAHAAMAAGQAVLVFVLVIVSIFKPWGKTGIRW